MNTIVVFLTFIVAAVNADSIGDWSSDVVADKWRIQAKNNIDAVLRKKRNTNIAKNLIFYLGDGMGKHLIFFTKKILKNQIPSF